MIPDAIVMAAGEGRRLRPLTERWAKPILPIDGRPVLATLLRELAAGGVERAFVVVGHLAEQVEALAGDGTAFGLAVSYAHQPEALGSADAVSRGLAAGAAPPALITAADTVYAPGTVGAFASAFAAAGSAGAIGLRRGLVPSRDKPGVRVEGGRVTKVVDYDESLSLTSAPLWAIGAELVPYVERVPGPPFELAHAYQSAIDDGLDVSAVEIPRTRDLTHPLDLVERNFPYLQSL